jgi:hypothetical protein
VLQTRFEYWAQHMFFLNRIQHVVMHHFGQSLTSEKLLPRPIRERYVQAALAHCELSARPGNEKLDCPLRTLARRLISAEGGWIKDIKEDEAATVQAVFGLQIKWEAAKGARWNGFWMVPLPGVGEIQEEVRAFEQFLAGRPESRATKAAADSIRRIAALISRYLADMAAHAAHPAPWDERERETRSAREDDLNTQNR